VRIKARQGNRWIEIQTDPPPPTRHPHTHRWPRTGCAQDAKNMPHMLCPRNCQVCVCVCVCVLCVLCVCVCVCVCACVCVCTCVNNKRRQRHTAKKDIGSKGGRKCGEESPRLRELGEPVMGAPDALAAHRERERSRAR
jgi:hypothetical protein